jgi:hypothetical protein
VAGLKTADTELHEAALWQLENRIKKQEGEFDHSRKATIAEALPPERVLCMLSETCLLTHTGSEVQKITEERNATLSQLVLSRHEQLQEQLHAFKASLMSHCPVADWIFTPRRKQSITCTRWQRARLPTSRPPLLVCFAHTRNLHPH